MTTVQHGSDRINVGAGAHGPLGPCLFRGHVAERPHDRARLRRTVAFDRVEEQRLRRLSRLAGAYREPPVHDVHHAERPDHDIVGLQVAVDHPARVGIGA